MKKTPSRKSRRENWNDFSTGADDLTISPFLSSDEVCRLFAKKTGAKKNRGSVEADVEDDGTDLWNKGADDFRTRRRAAADAKTARRAKRRAPDDASQNRDDFATAESKNESSDVLSDVSRDVSRGEPKNESRGVSRGAAKGRAKGRARGGAAKGSDAFDSAATASFGKKRSKRNRNVGSEPGDRGDSVGLRVVGGTFRGTKLEYAGDRRVRPMKERVREAIFNLLGDEVVGKCAIDLFAGTGALTFEAISRGATSAVAIEVHFPTARTTRRNIAILEEKAPGTAKKIKLETTDAFFWGRNIAATDPDAPPKRSPLESTSTTDLPNDVPWLVFCSPPYDFYVDRKDETLELLRTLRERAPKGSLFVVESDDRFDFDSLGVDIPPKKRRSYPPAEIGIFRK